MEEHTEHETEMQVTPLNGINHAISVLGDVATPVIGSKDVESVNVAVCTADDSLEAEDAGKVIDRFEDPLNIVIPGIAAPDGSASEEDPTYVNNNRTGALVVSHEIAELEGRPSATFVGVNSLIAEGALETSEASLRCLSNVALTSPAAMPELLVATLDPNREKSSDLMAGNVYAKGSELGETEHNEKSKENDHATITAVAEEAVQVEPLDEDMEDVLAKIRYKLTCESLQVLESGEILALPKGWTTRQSKTNDGKMYFVSPYGHTQWLRPPMKTGVIYNWVHEIEVTFGPGRLGLNLKQIAGIPGTEFTDLQVHIAEIYKLPNGMASPAEIYNWSVKPEKRLAVNMRVTAMSGISLTGYTYSEVLELLTRVVRPVRIKFADVSKGIVGRVDEEIPDEETDEGKGARAARLMQSCLRSEYFQILVSYELYRQVWVAKRHHMRLKMLEMQKKNEVMERQVKFEQQDQKSLEKEREFLLQETASLKQMIEQLDKQLASEIDSPEVLRTAELAQQTAVLEKDVAEIIAENDELQSSRVKIEETLDILQQELDAYGNLDVDFNGPHEVKFFSPAFLGSMVHRGSIDTRAEDARERLLEKIMTQRNHYEDEIKLEEERAKFVESEINHFRNQMCVAAEAVKREDAFISGKRPPQMIFLENKIALLKKNLNETMAGIAKATQSGDQQQADNLFIRRADLKDDLNAARVEMRRMESEFNVFHDVDQGESIHVFHPNSLIDVVNIDEAPHERVSESSRPQSKLAKLQGQLHETMAQLAKENDEARVKDEMNAVQDQSQELTQGALSSAAKSRDMDLRPSLTGPPMIQNVPRRSTGSSRASFGGSLRGLVSGARASMASDRASNNGKISESGPRGSNGASVASLTHNHDSNLNRDGSMPTMSGILRKHATHSNEKGAFGNMSIRGVRERWFNIEPDGFLRYYKREGDREPRGAILLKHKSLEILHGKEVGKPNEFMLCSPTHQTRMLAKTHEEMLGWVKVLELAHAFFLRQGCGSTDVGQDHGASAISPDAELAYRNQRATLGF